MFQKVDIRDYTYELPSERIATFPLEKRDESKLLVYRNGSINHETFRAIANHLPQDTLLFFNNTRVIQARLLFQKASGAHIEIFLLSPLLPSNLLADSMRAQGQCTWKCAVGNLKRWKDGIILSQQMNSVLLEAELVDRKEGIVTFRWRGDISFAELIESMGRTPLPPYLEREAVEDDKHRYQTIYSREEGAVAAPTAGLHFTPEVLHELEKKGIPRQFLTLHVSAGTFQPVKVENAVEHTMHREQVIVSRENITSLLDKNRRCIAVGTTSMRTLESLYWYGVHLEGDADKPFEISQKDAYTLRQDLSSERALENVSKKMEREKREYLSGDTSIYIIPGYQFRICKGLVTNFHQPGSTLILLVAAFIGEAWREVYHAALDNHYRFLSYGDSSLLLPS